MIWIALTFGLVSSLHCVLMCAPLQAVVMGQWLRNGKRTNWLLYHGGRLLMYAFLGLFVGLIGTAIGLPQWQREFTIVAGLVLLIGYFGLKSLQWDRKLYAIIAPFLMRLRPHTNGAKGKSWYFISGSLNGLLPCGMVYAALIPAAGATNPWEGGLVMLFFGLGTLPLLLSVNFASGGLMIKFSRHVQKLIPLSIILISAALILRGMDLGIPYLSPHISSSAAAVAQGCK